MEKRNSSTNRQRCGLKRRSVYEPTFSSYSHGFRPKRSCHTALKSLKKEFNGSTWFIEGDIKGCFDNIDHHVLVSVLNAKIKDARLIQLVWKFLKAGYVEDWKYYTTHSGCPQGGLCIASINVQRFPFAPQGIEPYGAKTKHKIYCFKLFRYSIKF